MFTSSPTLSRHPVLRGSTNSRLNLGFDFERRSGYVIIAPFDQQDVFSALPDDVADLVVVLFHVFNEYFFTRPLWPVNTNEQKVVACNIKAHRVLINLLICYTMLNISNKY